MGQPSPVERIRQSNAHVKMTKSEHRDFWKAGVSLVTAQSKLIYFSVTPPYIELLLVYDLYNFVYS